jgi:hypothetical protein
MISKRKKLQYFIISLLLALVFWRIHVFLFYNDGGISVIREVTNLTIHHYHYGIILLTLGLLMLLFYQQSKFSVILTGFGLGTILDSFVSRLFPASSRIQEIANYNEALLATIFLFTIISLLSILFYISKKGYKSKKPLKTHENKSQTKLKKTRNKNRK